MGVSTELVVSVEFEVFGKVQGKSHPCTRTLNQHKISALLVEFDLLEALQFFFVDQLVLVRDPL